MPQFREYPEVSNAIANDAILMERLGDGTVYIEFYSLANSVAEYIDIANSNAAQNILNEANAVLDVANGVLDTANSVLLYAETNAIIQINEVFANAEAAANAILANASQNYGNATAFINGVLAQANAAANAAENAANTAQAAIDAAVANALSTANGMIVANYVAQASTFADQANGYAQSASFYASISASNAALAYSASSSAAYSASNAANSEAGSATYSINAAQSAVNAQLFSTAASIYSSEAGSYSSNSQQSAFAAKTYSELANTSASNAAISSSQAAASSNTANSASAAAIIQYTLAAAAAANASAYSASAQAYSNIAVAAASDANSSQSAAASFLGLTIQAKNDATNSATNASVYENQALNSATNAIAAASTASTQAGIATTAATGAGQSANSSIQYANIANTYASNALQSATAASASALVANTGAASSEAYTVTALNASNSAAGYAASAQSYSVLAAQYSNSVVSANYIYRNADFTSWIGNTSVSNGLSIASWTGSYSDVLVANANTIGALAVSNYNLWNTQYSNKLTRYTPASNPYAIELTRNPPNLTYNGSNIDVSRQNASGIFQGPTSNAITSVQAISAGWYVLECDIAFAPIASSTLDYSGVIFYDGNFSQAGYINFATDPTINGTISNSVVLGYGSAAYVGKAVGPGYTTAFENVRQYRKLVYIANTTSMSIACMLYSPYFWTNSITDVFGTSSTAYPSNLTASPKRTAILSHLAVRQASAAEIAGNTANAAVPVIQSQIVSLQNTVATQNSTTATAIAGLTSQYNTQNSAILTLQTTVADNANTSATQFNTLSSNLTNTNANVSTLSTTVVNQNSALSSQITLLSSNISNTNANVSTLSNTFVTANSATASQITTLNSQYNTLSANVAILANSITNATGASSSYSLQLDANGVVTGMQTFAGSNGISTFDVYASNFTLSDPNSPALKYKPLSFSGGLLRLGNTVVDGNLIINGTVVTNTIGLNAVSNVNYAGGDGSTSTKQDIGSLTVQTYGFPCTIVAYFFATPIVGPAYVGFANELRRDGNLIGKASIVAVQGSTLSYQVTINLVETPTAGTHVYSMSCPEGYTVNFTGWNIQVTELKR